MTIRDCVLTTLNHKQPDKIPYQIEFTQNAYTKMVKFYNDVDFVSKLGNCLVRLETESKNSWEEVSSDIWEDEFGVQWNRKIDKDIGNVCNCVISLDNINRYKFPDPNDLSRYSKYNEVIRMNPDSFIVADIGFSLFERAWTLVGMENLLMMMVTNKNFVHSLLDKILEFNLKIIENAILYNIDAIQFGDDWGQQSGLIMGPILWREFIKPRIKEMYKLVKSKNKFVFIHSCGKVDELFPDLIECGVDVFNPFQPEVIDVFETKKKYGKQLSFYGGISTQKTLPYGTVDQIKDEIKKLLDIVGANGGYIIAPAHAITGDIKPENINAMIEILQNQGKEN